MCFLLHFLTYFVISHSARYFPFLINTNFRLKCDVLCVFLMREESAFLYSISLEITLCFRGSFEEPPFSQQGVRGFANHNFLPQWMFLLCNRMARTLALFSLLPHNIWTYFWPISDLLFQKGSRHCDTTPFSCHSFLASGQRNKALVLLTSKERVLSGLHIL